VRRAHELSESGHTRGKIILTVSSEPSGAPGALATARLAASRA
jgi:hypothetical protein